MASPERPISAPVLPLSRIGHPATRGGLLAADALVSRRIERSGGRFSSLCQEGSRDVARRARIFGTTPSPATLPVTNSAPSFLSLSQPQSLHDLRFLRDSGTVFP